MRQKWKRFLAYVLTVAMLLGVMPDTAIVGYAEEVMQETTDEVVVTEESSEETPSVDTESEPELEESTMAVTSEEGTEEVTSESVTTEESSEVSEEEITAATSEVQTTTETTTEVVTQPIVESESTTETELTTETTTEDGTESELLQPNYDEIEPSVQSDGLDPAFVIYNDGTWATDKYRWYVNVDGKKHYVFCLDYGRTMRSGLYSGNLTAGYSGISAFRKAVALNYFYKLNGNSWSGSKGYGDVQYAIWDSKGTETSEKLLDYANLAWKLTSLNSERKPGSSSYSSKLKGIKKSEQESDAARKQMISQLTDGKNVIDLSGSFNATSNSYQDTIKLNGTAWKYFNNGGFDGGSSDIFVDGVYDTDGKKVSNSTASVDGDGNLSVNIKSTPTMGSSENNAYTIIMHVDFDYKGASSINYLFTPEGKQNLSYDASFNTAAYFAVRVYGNIDSEGAKLYINKVDEFGNFVSGCTFQLTGVQGDALTNRVSHRKTVNDESDYFKIEYPGYYKLVEIAVPSSEYTLDTTEHYVYAAYNDNAELLIYPAYKFADGYNYDDPDATLGGYTGNHQGVKTASFRYYFPNKYNGGAATLTKNSNVLVKYENGKFVYEKRTLDNVGFTFHAAEDIYINDTLVFSKDEEIYSGTPWGGYTVNGNGNKIYNHSVAIDGKLVEATTHQFPPFYRGYTANGGKITISELPPGAYYCVESDLTHPGLVIALNRHYFDVVAGQTETVNGSEGIVNEQAPTDVYVYKQDQDTKEYLAGADITIYANINNTNYDGQKLFTDNQTVDVVVERNLANGEETIESDTWIPIQTSTTNDRGIAVFDNLPYGDYLIAEVKAPEGYELSENTIRFTHVLSENAESFASGFVSEYTIGDIKTSDFKIYKNAEKAYLNTSAEKNVDAYVYKEEKIAGAVFGIYADAEIKNTLGEVVFKQGDLVKKCTTDEEGIAQFGGAMFVGKYYFQEIQTADDSIYQLDTTKHYFEVTGTEGTKNLTDEALVNKQYKGSIKVIKTDGETTVALADVEFNLLDAEKKVIGTYVTDANGEIYIKNLPVGTYYLQETKTKKGYKLDDEMVEVVISVDDLHKLVEIENERSDTKITITTNSTYSGSGYPRTGDASPIGFIMLLFILSSFGTAYLSKKNGMKLKPLSVRAKKLMALVLVVAGVACLGGLTVKAAAELKDIATEELKDVEYNGTVYKYALQKQYETTNKDEVLLFEDEVDGMKLADVQYEIVDTILQKETLETTKDYKDLLVKDESKVAETLTIDGNVYKIQDITWSEVPNMETVTYTVDYGYQTAEPTPDATYEYTYTSPVTKEDNTVTLPFARLEKGSETWVDGFSATVTFHNLDGLYFTLGNHEFEYDSDKLSLTENDFKELVNMLGYDTSKYRLNNISWSGKEYKKDGQKCRDAKATGQQYAASYKAHYEDEVENGKIYTAHATYICEVEVPAEEAAPTYVKTATAYYEDASVWTNIITFVTEHKAMSVAFVGLLLFIIMVIIYMLRRPKRAVNQVEDTYIE